MSMNTEPILQVKDVHVCYGSMRVLNGVTLSFNEGEIVALMGPNGAGKSTVLKAIFGMVPIRSGEVYWCGNPFRPAPRQAIQSGIAFVPQGRRVFGSLSVEENLRIGGYVLQDVAEVQKRIAQVLNLFPILQEKRKQAAASLSGGQQQVLALARGLMLNPRVLLLDEPSLGLAPKAVKEVFEHIAEIHRKRKTAIMIVEHNIRSVLSIANRGYVLDKGSVVFDGPAENIVKDGVLERVFTGAM